MKKLPKSTLLSFRSDIVAVLSPWRLESYEGNIKSYYDNRLLALKAGHKIAEIEIYLRNILDFCLCQLIGENWIKSERSLELIKIKNNTHFDELSPNQILSSLMLGEIVKLVKEYRIEDYMFDLTCFDFKKYHWSNRNFCFVNNKKTPFTQIEKNTIVLNLIKNIRNRAFHWENLLKTTIKENGEVFPRITHKEKGTRIGIAPELILQFLDDLIENIGNSTIESYRNVRVEYER